jgi:hypothetical protein
MGALRRAKPARKSRPSLCGTRRPDAAKSESEASCPGSSARVVGPHPRARLATLSRRVRVIDNRRANRFNFRLSTSSSSGVHPSRIATHGVGLVHVSHHREHAQVTSALTTRAARAFGHREKRGESRSVRAFSGGRLFLWSVVVSGPFRRTSRQPSRLPPRSGPAQRLSRGDQPHSQNRGRLASR